MDKLIDYLVKQINSKGVLGVTPPISIFILALIFISPSYIFIFFFKRNLFINYTLSINIFTVLIFDMLLFLVLFIIGSLRDIEIDINKNNKLKFIDKGTSFKDAIMNIMLMGVVSIILTLTNSLFLVMGWIIDVKVGILTLCVILFSIFICYVLAIIKKALLIIWKSRRGEGENVLLIIIKILFFCVIFILEIIRLAIEEIWNIIVVGKNIKE